MRRLLAAALGSMQLRASSAELESAVLGFAALHGAGDLVPELVRGIRTWRAAGPAREDHGDSRRAHYGVRITAARGSRWIEAWLDCVLEDPAGATVLVEWEEPSCEAAGEDAGSRDASEARLLWKALALEDGPDRVREAGRFFLVLSILGGLHFYYCLAKKMR